MSPLSQRVSASSSSKRSRQLGRAPSLTSPFTRCFGGVGGRGGGCSPESPRSNGDIIARIDGICQYRKLISEEEEEEEGPLEGEDYDQEQIPKEALEKQEDEEDGVSQLEKPATPPRPTALRRSLSLIVSLRSDSTFSCKVRGACEQMLDMARKSSPHVIQLFAGNQLLMQVTSSSSVVPLHSHHHIAMPSAGFLQGLRSSSR